MMPSDPNKAALGSRTTSSESTPVDSVKVQVLLLVMKHAKRCGMWIGGGRKGPAAR